MALDGVLNNQIINYKHSQLADHYCFNLALTINFFCAQAESITKEEPKQNGVPDVIHISPQPGLTWTRKEKVWFRHSDGISSAHVVEPGKWQLF